ncbi:MAG: hypothetical protein ACE37F_37145 [Nannocystaceae bacterium]
MVRALERRWVGSNCDFSGPEQLEVWKTYIFDKFENSEMNMPRLERIEGAAELERPRERCGPTYGRLAQHAQFSRFEMKRGLMEGFEEKVGRLAAGLERLSDAEGG